eukprot:GEMP01055897.1.p3 GENE.GEMP01055897.1~~GEMP01055897.1.p3  ORF type:complete len:133 (+),score=33.85 GEMP01055897.1:47-445(+)
MGACCGKDKRDENAADPYRSPAPKQAAPRPQGNAKPSIDGGSGQMLGGSQPLSKDQAREKQLAAAEARQKNNEHRGLGSTERATELKEKAEKEDLIGKIKAWHDMKNMDAPMGLPMASLEQLRATYDRIRKE